MRKSEKNTGMNSLIHGGHSNTIKSLQERMSMLPLDDVKKMEFQSMLDQMQTTSWAFDFDRAIKSHLIESVQDTDKKLMGYMADLQNTQVRIAKMEKDVSFHNAVLQDLKQQWIDEADVDKKESIYRQIVDVEKTISGFERSVSGYIDLRNKIRKEIDKGKYQDKALKIKENESRGTSKTIDADWELLDL